MSFKFLTEWWRRDAAENRRTSFVTPAIDNLNCNKTKRTTRFPNASRDHAIMYNSNDGRREIYSSTTWLCSCRNEASVTNHPYMSAARCTLHIAPSSRLSARESPSTVYAYLAHLAPPTIPLSYSTRYSYIFIHAIYSKFIIICDTWLKGW